MSNPGESPYPPLEGPPELQSEASTVYNDVPETPGPVILNPSPDVMDLLERMVQDRLQEKLVDIQLQTAAQVEAWARQETAMARQIEALQTQLLIFSLQADSANTRPITGRLVSSPFLFRQR